MADTLEDEVDIVIAKIYEVLGQEPQYTYKDVAILARANSHLEPFVMALRQKGIPYQLVGNRGLYDRDEIRDVIALMKIIINPEDNISIYRAMNIPSMELSYEDISNVLTKSRVQKKDLWAIISTEEKDTIKSFYSKVAEYQKNVSKRTPVEFVYEIVHGSGYLSQYIEDETIENQLALKNLDLLLNIIKRFEVDFRSEKREFPTVVDLLDYLELMVEAGDNPAQAEVEDIDTVNLLTTHAAKGLEFPVVFVINMVSDRFPTRNQGDMIDIPTELIKETLRTGDEHLQEERRLFYVAITRAQKYLFMTLGKNYGGKRDKKPSGYLEETGLPITEVKLNTKTNVQESLFGVDTPFRETHASKITNFTPSFMSYSQANTYITCPLQYKYKYVLNIPTVPNHALSFGTTIHDTLKEFHTKKAFDQEVTLKELLDIYEKHWQPLGYMNEEHRPTRFESGKIILADYYAKNADSKNKPIALEKSFNIRIGGIKFFGRIDRIDPLPDGGVEIVDYKTGNIKSQKEVDQDMQVALYAIAVKESLGMNPELMSLYFVEGGEKVSTTRDETQMAETKRELTEVVEKIKSGKFEATPGMPCTWCDFKEICPFAYKA